MTTLSDLFPEASRTLYRNSPLTQVICQVRFPVILRVESDPPASFQEEVRGTLPIFERQIGPPLGAQMPLDLARLLGAAAPTPTYIFRSEDGNEAVTLTPDALTLTNTKYKRWEAFGDVFRLALKALVKIYGPSFYTRVGLRYQNVVARDEIGLTGVAWPELIRRELMGELTDAPWLESATDARRVVTVATETGSLLFQHGFAQPGITSSYIIDIDLFSDLKTETADAEKLLDKLHSFASRAFRWSITDRLHDALGPGILDADDERRVA